MHIPAPTNFLDLIQAPASLEQTTITDMFEFIQYLTYVLFLDTPENRTIKPLLFKIELASQLANQHSRFIESYDQAIVWQTMYNTFLRIKDSPEHQQQLSIRDFMNFILQTRIDKEEPTISLLKFFIELDREKIYEKFLAEINSTYPTLYQDYPPLRQIDISNQSSAADSAQQQLMGQISMLLPPPDFSFSGQQHWFTLTMGQGFPARPFPNIRPQAQAQTQAKPGTTETRKRTASEAKLDQPTIKLQRMLPSDKKPKKIKSIDIPINWQDTAHVLDPILVAKYRLSAFDVIEVPRIYRLYNYMIYRTCAQTGMLLAQPTLLARPPLKGG